MRSGLAPPDLEDPRMGPSDQSPNRQPLNVIDSDRSPWPAPRGATATSSYARGMDETRARELVARRIELTKKLGALLDEYVDCLRPGGLEAMWWNDAMKSPGCSESHKTEQTIQLGEFEESIYEAHVVAGWVAGVELAESFPEDQDHSIGVTRTYLSPIHQSPSMSYGLHDGASN